MEAAAHPHDDHDHHHDHEEIDLNPATWRDTKRYAWLLGLIIPLAPFIAWGSVEATGWSVFYFTGPFLVFGVFPLLDLAIGVDPSNPPDSILKWLEQDRYYRWCTYLFIPVQYAGLVLACWLWSSGDLSVFDSLGLAVTMGVVGGIAINTAHELGHKRDNAERWLSRVALAQTGYGHFYIEHNRGHHVRVSTPEDPASSRFGETFWEFLPRSVIGSARSSVHLEAQRIRRLGKSPSNPRTYLSNDVLNAWAMSAVLFGALIAVFGAGVIPFIVIQAIFGFSLLEAVNYLEHYGLLRQKLDTPSGGKARYERCAPGPTWNSATIATNLFFSHFNRPTDNHANPTRRYRTLRSMEGAPNLPSGYASMISLTYFPPLWRKVMDHRVLEHYDGDITKVNVQPRLRKKVLAKYGAAA